MKLKLRIDVHIHNHSGEVAGGGCVLASLRSIAEQIGIFMSAIKDFAEKVDAHNAKIDSAVDGLVGDISGLKHDIAALRASLGTVSAEDQAILDRLEIKSSAIADKLAALDAETPPVAPPA